MAVPLHIWWMVCDEMALVARVVCLAAVGASLHTVWWCGGQAAVADDLNTELEPFWTPFNPPCVFKIFFVTFFFLISGKDFFSLSAVDRRQELKQCGWITVIDIYINENNIHGRTKVTDT